MVDVPVHRHRPRPELLYPVHPDVARWWIGVAGIVGVDGVDPGQRDVAAAGSDGIEAGHGIVDPRRSTDSAQVAVQRPALDQGQRE
jgi:hypothetical protein